MPQRPADAAPYPKAGARGVDQRIGGLLTDIPLKTVHSMIAGPFR
ncbi:hypothetical protein [Halostella pelagica]|nr:hypothetical protein [Halostella pelagica]